MLSFLDLLGRIYDSLKGSLSLFGFISNFFSGFFDKLPFLNVSKHKEGAIFIFTFGVEGSGKSTIAASLGTIVDEEPESILKYNLTETFGTQFLINDWIRRIRSKKFPPRSDVEVIEEIDVGIGLINKSGVVVPLTFIEISGERFRVINPSFKDIFTGAIEKEIVDYMVDSKIHMIVCDVTKFDMDNTIIPLYIQYLESVLYNSSDNYYVALVLSKWDQVEGQYTSAKQFVKEKLPSVYKSIQVHSKVKIDKVFTFSIGKTKDSTSEGATAEIGNIKLRTCQKNCRMDMGEIYKDIGLASFGLAIGQDVGFKRYQAKGLFKIQDYYTFAKLVQLPEREFYLELGEVVWRVTKVKRSTSNSKKIFYLIVTRFEGGMPDRDGRRTYFAISFIFNSNSVIKPSPSYCFNVLLENMPIARKHWKSNNGINNELVLLEGLQEIKYDKKASSHYQDSSFSIEWLFNDNSKSVEIQKIVVRFIELSLLLPFKNLWLNETSIYQDSEFKNDLNLYDLIGKKETKRFSNSRYHLTRFRDSKGNYK